MPTPPQMATTYNPESWLVTAMRSLADYLKWGLNNSIANIGGIGFTPVVYDAVANPSGIVEVVLGFPGDLNSQKVPIPRAIVHLEIDNIDGRIIGQGDNIFRDNYDAVNETWNGQEAREHRISLDVGIWTSDRAGGTTLRLEIRQLLDDLFLGTKANRNLMAATESNFGDGGLEILDFTGGRFITETINDVRTFRMVDGSLEVRCYSRTRLDPADAVPSVETIEQSPGLSITP